MNSLQRRLQLGLTLSLMLLMALLWWGGSLAVRKLGEDLIGSRLEHDAESLLAALEFGGTAPARIPGKQVNPIYNRPFSGHYFVIRFADGSAEYSRSLWDQTLDVRPLQPGGGAHWYAAGPSGQKLLVWARHYRKQGHAFTLAVAEDLTPLERHLSLFQWTFAGIALAVLFVLLLVQQRVIHGSFRRLESVRADIRRLERGETGTLSEDVPDEILPLVRELNRLLELLARRLERSRNALGNLAHALKGPLNLLVQYLDGEELESHPELRARTRTQTERIRQLVERELKRARLAGGGSPGRRFDARQELPDLVEVLRQVHRRDRLDIRWDVADETPAFGDREDMLELLGNLLDNACKWADARVRCRISGADTIRITVEDDGPGRTEQEMNQLARRGVRLDETVEGHGLGLAIAKDIVKLYNGGIRFDRSGDLGGLRVSVELRQTLEHGALLFAPEAGPAK